MAAWAGIKRGHKGGGYSDGIGGFRGRGKMSFSLTQVTDFHSPRLQEINV